MRGRCDRSRSGRLQERSGRLQERSGRLQTRSGRLQTRSVGRLRKLLSWWSVQHEPTHGQQ
ncbi:MAG: hypothetical protein HOG99_02860 [Gemmatimonadetes bacterium]|nr:hypothetical protein [Gemmatimonadota bacterium]MBT7454240.1 hypothetical protein [Gemmatimonadota bacterium]